MRWTDALKPICTVQSLFLILLLGALTFSEAFGKTKTPSATSPSFEAALAAAFRAEGDGHLVEAEKQYKTAIRIAEGLPPGDTRVTKALQYLGNLYQSTGRLPEAEEAFKRALKINTEVLGPDHYDVAGTLGSLGGLYILQQRFDEAESFLKRAHEIEEATWESDNPRKAYPAPSGAINIL